MAYAVESTLSMWNGQMSRPGMYALVHEAKTKHRSDDGDNKTIRIKRYAPFSFVINDTREGKYGNTPCNILPA